MTVRRQTKNTNSSRFFKKNQKNIAVIKYVIHQIHVSQRVLNMATSIRLPSGVEDRLNHLASRTGRTKAYYLREMIERGIDEAEEYYLAAETSERVRKGEERIYSTDQIRADLGLDD